jgi:hypothetical protein
LSLAGSVFLCLGIFNKPLGLSETWEWVAPILAIACFILLIVLRRRRRNARLTVGLPAAEKAPPNRRFWLLLFLLVAVSLSGPLWLPYTDTGSSLPTSTLIITSIISCAVAILIFVLCWRYWNKRSNQSLEATAGRRDDQIWLHETVRCVCHARCRQFDETSASGQICSVTVELAEPHGRPFAGVVPTRFVLIISARRRRRNRPSQPFAAWSALVAQ